MSHWAAYHVLSAAVLVFMLVIGSNSELTQGEVEALEAILQKYPNLANVTVLSRYDSENVQVDRGAPWTNDFGQVCTHGEGYDLYGIHCSADGHIDAISLYVPLFSDY